jgi:hypothetical protein
MGLLDDAIREHLELKRRHGADPSEVERQEHEALGPARRSAAPPADTVYDEDVPAGALDDEDELYDDDEFEYEDELPAASAPVAEPETPVAPPAPARREEHFEREPADRAEEVVDDLEPVDEEDLDLPPSAERVAGDEPGAGKDPAEEEDVLEETPEFLQETPEHDRLWFEQKPPRDFEF